jgi:anti-sigma factor ChrR (cupin superfamily)
MLTCRQLVKESDQLLAGELSWRRRLSIKFHLLMCRHCRRYIAQLRLLIAAFPYIHTKATAQEVEKVMQNLHSGQ